MMIFSIGCNDAGQRVDKFLTKACPKLPQSLLYKAFRKKDIKQNGKWCKPDAMLCEGDELKVFLPDDCLVPKMSVSSQTAGNAAASVLENLPASEVVFEDDCIAVLYKPVGLPVHADDRGTEDTLIGRFLAYLTSRGEYLPQKELSFTPALCNRLDRNTEGLVIGAKSAAALRCMNEKIRCGEVNKEYLCVTVGAPPKQKDIVTAYHRKEKGNRVRLEERLFDGAKETRTGYEVICQSRGLSLVRVRLYTGRTHQIRAQMAALGCPILGDGAYGDAAANRKYGERFQLLTACRLLFDFSEADCVLSHLRGKVFEISPAFVARYFPQM